MNETISRFRRNKSSQVPDNLITTVSYYYTNFKTEKIRYMIIEKVKQDLSYTKKVL